VWFSGLQWQWVASSQYDPALAEDNQIQSANIKGEPFHRLMANKKLRTNPLPAAIQQRSLLQLSVNYY
jgi:hypothetical protein